MGLKRTKNIIDWINHIGRIVQLCRLLHQSRCHLCFDKKLLLCSHETPQQSVTGTGNFSFFLVTGKKSWNRYWKNLVPEKVPEPVLEKNFSIIFEFRRFIMGTGTGTRNFSFILVVSEKFGTEKKSRNWYW